MQVNSVDLTRLQVLVDNANAVAVSNLLTMQLTSLIITTGDSENAVDLNAVTQAFFPNLTNISISTGNGDDTIIRSPDIIDRIDARNSNDTINAQGGNDLIVAGDGNDSLLGGGRADLVDGGDGNDSVQGRPPAAIVQLRCVISASG